ncbi:MAG: restriction endonuclease subunit S [Prevotella sp.]|nr:restriction endonuclease subunit S [Prevotella sp.]
MVEWKKLGEVASYYRGVTYNKKQEVPFNSGGTKILRANNITLETNSLNFEDVKEISSNVIIKDFQWLYPNDILICAGSGSKEHVGKVAYISSPLKYAYGGFMGKIIASEELKPRFLFHIFSSSIFKKYLDVALNSTTINNLNSTLVNDFQIPIPSLSEQERIVGILDTFTASIDNIKAQIEQRRKQYEHYRNTLLTFNKDDDCVEWNTLGEVAEIGTGSGNTNEGLAKGLYPFYTRGQEILRKNEYEYDEQAVVTAGDGVGVGKVIHYVEGKYALHQRAYRFCPKKNLNTKFLFYYMKVTFYKYVCGNAVASSVSSLRKPKLQVYPIPLPSLQEQQRIVSILNTFEASINNLEAQLEQRQKQYEYYREKLLTFE